MAEENEKLKDDELTDIDREAELFCCEVTLRDDDTRISHYTEGLKLYPNSGYILRSRGIAYQSKKEYDLAIEDFTKASTINQKAWSLSLRGDAYLEKGEYDLAIADFTEQAKLEPDSGNGISNRGKAYLRKGEYDLAILDFTQAMKLDGPSAVYHLYYRGDTYMEKEDWDSAIADYTETLRIVGSPKYFIRRSIAYSKKGEYDKAIEDCNKAISCYNYVADAFNTRGLTHEKKGEYDKAIVDFNVALAIEPDNEEYQKNLERIKGNSNA
ncbi:hypothetical protein AGMMS50268_13030 [Spirochaetia bacterium]|nr:hypothetical protein AGMMS50268_13030 [Spirochaetia bacterium]